MKLSKKLLPAMVKCKEKEILLHGQRQEQKVAEMIDEEAKE